MEMVYNPTYPKITLEAARVNAHLHQSVAAKKLGITPETLRRYEKGKTSPTVEMLDRICKLYQFPKDYIFLT